MVEQVQAAEHALQAHATGHALYASMAQAMLGDHCAAHASTAWVMIGDQGKYLGKPLNQQKRQSQKPDRCTSRIGCRNAGPLSRHAKPAGGSPWRGNTFLLLLLARHALVGKRLSVKNEKATGQITHRFLHCITPHPSGSDCRIGLRSGGRDRRRQSRHELPSTLRRHMRLDILCMHRRLTGKQYVATTLLRTLQRLGR